MQLTTRQMTRGAMMAALALAVGISGLGQVPVPTPAQYITWVHVPVIISGILMGPAIGGIVGLIWGCVQFMHLQSQFPDPLVHIVPRVCVGVFSALSFQLVERVLERHPGRITIGAAVAAVVGTLTNTGGVLGLAVARGYFTTPVALGVAVIHGPIELALAVVLTVPVTVALYQRTRPA